MVIKLVKKVSDFLLELSEPAVWKRVENDSSTTILVIGFQIKIHHFLLIILTRTHWKIQVFVKH